MSYQKYIEHCQKIADIHYSIALLQWDQEVNMPEKGAEARSRQISTLSVIAHEWSTDKNFGRLLEELSKDSSLTWEQKRNIELSFKDYQKQLKYNSEFVKKLSSAISKAFNAWQAARKANNFEIFAPALEEIVALKREETKLLGYKDHPYNALMDEYEPGATVEMIDSLFNGVKFSLSELLEKISQKDTPDNKFAGKKYEATQQWKITEEFLQNMGYDFSAGRQDYAPHPFCTNFNAQDVRVTTRSNEDDLFDMLSSSIHEGGHALYEQGLLMANYGLPAGSYISLGIHESQSRLWENNVGRSEAFWKSSFKIINKHFPQQCAGLSEHDAFIANNIIQSSLIRVQADELTYHFHIMIRYELEKRLIEGSLEVKDLRIAWNEMYKKYLGLDVKSDNEGVLQDIHWAHGSMGYFATYSLGSFYAAQFYHQAQKEMPDLEDKIKNGHLLVLKNWLNQKIHQYGRLYSAEEICQKVTGEKLNFEYFHQYLENKLKTIYNW
ncbi:MAG: carboxypeptidase M32 [Chitinophagales bacterium]|nr:carboxypeptidase M32 [Chitinophagales bacterium]MCZ2392366.1 carboxypeptidase M32 [Chitinophagales bacterium]